MKAPVTMFANTAWEFRSEKRRETYVAVASLSSPAFLTSATDGVIVIVVVFVYGSGVGRGQKGGGPLQMQRMVQGEGAVAVVRVVGRGGMEGISYFTDELRSFHRRVKKGKRGE
jgi:hypothetical protein